MELCKILLEVFLKMKKWKFLDDNQANQTKVRSATLGREPFLLILVYRTTHD